jgi:N-acetylglucosaminyl-diphospho-decaprenol L-rhamnosyltransferase
MDVSILIVNYKTRELLRQCLSSIFTSGCGPEFEVIVVDNDSRDGSVEMVREEFPQVILIDHGENAGLAHGNNVAAAMAGGQYLLFMNPDTVIRSEALEKMVAYMRDHLEVGILGPKLVYPDGELQDSCRSFYKIRTIVLRRTFFGRLFPESSLLRHHLMEDYKHDVPREVDWMLGACLMMPRRVCDAIGGWDEGYKLYFEDVDICWRVKMAGYKVMYFPEAVVVHHHRRDSAQGFSRKTVRHIVSAIRFLNKYGWKW